MKRNTQFIIIAIVVVTVTLLIIFWKKLFPKAVDALNDIASSTGLQPKKQFNAGDDVDSTVDGLNFRTGAGTTFESTYKFSAGQPVGKVITGTDANGWVKVQRFTGSLDTAVGYVYSAYLIKVETTVSTGHGAGGTW